MCDVVGLTSIQLLLLSSYIQIKVNIIEVVCFIWVYIHFIFNVNMKGAGIGCLLTQTILKINFGQDNYLPANESGRTLDVCKSTDLIYYRNIIYIVFVHL